MRALLVVVALCAPARADGPRWRVALVGNEHGHSISVIDLATWRTATIAVPVIRPTGLVIDPDGRRAYVAGRGTPTLAVLELSP
jgi:DNA-binding beta-propeller fold protein YncE